MHLQALPELRSAQGKLGGNMKILLAEDDPQVRIELQELLVSEEFEVVTAVDGIDAYEKFIEDTDIELMLLDIRMPRCTGLQTLEAINKTESNNKRIFETVFITGNNDSESIVTALNLGAFAFLFKPVIVEQLIEELENARDSINIKRYRKFQRETLEAKVIDSSSQISRLSNALSSGVGSAIELLAISAEHYIPGIDMHLNRVGEMSACLAERLGMTKQQCQDLRLASMLHDIGKLQGPEVIYNAARELTAEEFEQTKAHTLLGQKFLSRSNEPVIELAATICAQHHEKWDGSGYPHQLTGEEIALEASIVHVVDVYDNLRTERLYREALPHAKAIDIMVNGDNKSIPDHFNPAVLQALLVKHRDIEAIYNRYRAAAIEP